MPQVPDLWGRLLTAALSVAATLAGAWLTRRWDERRAARDAESGAGWRAEMVRQMTLMREAQHVQMRHELIHDAEKMLDRGYVTGAERQSWWDEYNAYDALGENGYIASYWLRIQALPIREIGD